MRLFKITLALATLISCFAFAKSKDPEVIKDVNLEKYSGTWYEIGHNPNFFQNLCERSTAQYTLNEAGSIEVLNTCFRDEKVVSTISGLASVPDVNEPAKLVVDFGFMRKGDYWIIGLDQDYQWALVSGPQKESLFILSRTAPMDPSTLEMILQDLQKRGFDTSKIVFDKYSN
jgi:apolipoprotein D and lipocalin family protein